MNVLITGCNRGLGLGLVQRFAELSNSPKNIFATCRNMEKAKELQDLRAKHSNIHILEIDLQNFDSYKNLIKHVGDVVKNDGINLLINNAGVGPKTKTLDELEYEDLRDVLTTNTIMPIMFTKACLPLLRKASKANQNKKMGIERAAIINISSIRGSIASNTDGAKYPYRTSKAGLNAATKSMSIDLSPDKILCVSIHPGWVRTDVGGKDAPLDVTTSTMNILSTLLTFNESHNGGFFRYDGGNLPW
ncbi:C-factor-like [Teleopsis dalmanni]|uniref:C-factor-like n=1 Tax=Teleopsis dalmanni TaxID=139649 RepID=UPI0018CFE9A8|nr:C-factor-like [Teleopsis dalmanni]XP_037940354.1 C-factor-like [Teleopsis dalmanni]